MKFTQRLSYFTRAGHTRAIWLVYDIRKGAKWLDPIKVIEEGCTGRPPETSNMANMPNQPISGKEFKDWLSVAKGRGILA